MPQLPSGFAQSIRTASMTVRNNTASLLCPLLVVALAATATAQSNTVWKGGDGAWETEANWQSTVPVSGRDARFTSATLGTHSQVSISGNAESQLLEVREKDVSITFFDGSSLTSTGVRIGQTGKGNLTLTANAGATTAVNLGVILLGYTVGINENSLTLSGTGMKAGALGNRTRVGTSSNSNVLTVQNGASLRLHSLRIGGFNQANGNSFVVTGVDSSATIENDTLDIGAGTGVVGDYHYENKLAVRNGGLLTSSKALNLSHLLGTHSNTVEVDGVGAKLVMKTGAAITLGKSGDALNVGGNSISVKNGGRLESDGDISIYGYNTLAATGYGKNSLIIGDSGTLIQTGATRSVLIGSEAFLRLSATGTLESTSLVISAGGLLEAAGSGLKASTTSLDGGSVLRIGHEGRTTAALLTVEKEVNFGSGSMMEARIFDADSADSVSLASTGEFTFASNVTLKILLEGYDPVIGDSWSFLVGESGTFTGDFSTFVLPTLQGGLMWDQSGLNVADSWTIAVIPEPSWTSLVLVGFGVIGVCRMRALRHRTARTA